MAAAKRPSTRHDSDRRNEPLWHSNVGSFRQSLWCHVARLRRARRATHRRVNGTSHPRHPRIVVIAPPMGRLANAHRHGDRRNDPYSNAGRVTREVHLCLPGRSCFQGRPQKYLDGRTFVLHNALTFRHPSWRLVSVLRRRSPNAFDATKVAVSVSARFPRFGSFVGLLFLAGRVVTGVGHQPGPSGSVPSPGTCAQGSRGQGADRRLCG
jgi:hypothetical protein